MVISELHQTRSLKKSINLKFGNPNFLNTYVSSAYVTEGVQKIFFQSCQTTRDDKAGE